MSLAATVLAAALHVAVGFVVWEVAPPLRRDMADDAIEITMEEPPAEQVATAPAPAPPPAAPLQPRPAPQTSMAARDPLGLPPEPPEAEPSIEPPKLAAPVPEPEPDPSQPPPQVAEPKPEPAQPPVQVAEPEAETPKPTVQAAEPTPEPAQPAAQAPEPAPVPRQEAAAVPPPQPPPAPAAPEPSLEKMLPPVEAPPAPLSMHDFAKVLPPPAAPPRPPPPPPPQHTTPQPSTLAPSPLQRSPLSSASRQPPPTGAATSAFVNPAQNAATSRVKDAYLWQVVRKFSQYLPDLRQKNEGGTVVLRFAIARDGRLVDASIVQSSGVIALDRGLLESLRAASPYPPLPPEIPGSQVVFTQPIAAKR